MAPADIGNAPPAYAASADPDPLRGKRIRLDGPTDRRQKAADSGTAAHLEPAPNKGGDHTSSFTCRSCRVSSGLRKGL